MQQKIDAIFTKRVLELNDSLRFNDSLSSCSRALKGKLCGTIFSNFELLDYFDSMLNRITLYLIRIVKIFGKKLSAESLLLR